MSQTNNGANLGFESKLWEMADTMRGYMDASEYKHVVLGLIFLKYISDAFQHKYDELAATQETKYTDPEDRDEYLADNIFWVPPEARWEQIQAQSPQPVIGKVINEAMTAIERENPSLKGVLPTLTAMESERNNNRGRWSATLSSRNWAPRRQLPPRPAPRNCFPVCWMRLICVSSGALAPWAR